MGTPTRWGFMGAGKIASDFANAITTLLSKNDHEIIAVAAGDLKRAQAFAEKFQIKHAVEGYENLVKCADVDIVYISTLHPQHLQCVKIALNAGKHVLCEKPLAMNVREVREMVNLARQKDVFFMEAFWTRCFPVFDEIRKALKEGRIGEPKVLHGILAYRRDPSEIARIFVKDLGGSAMLDTGCYLVMTATFFFNGERPEEVQVFAKMNEDGVDTVDAVTLRYKNNRYAQIITSTEGPEARRVIVYGTNGYLEYETTNSPSRLVINKETIVHPMPEEKAEYYYSGSQGLSYQAEHVRNCLLKGLKQSPFMPWEHSDVIASILDEIRRQAGVVYPQDSSA